MSFLLQDRLEKNYYNLLTYKDIEMLFDFWSLDQIRSTESTPDSSLQKEKLPTML